MIKLRHKHRYILKEEDKSTMSTTVIFRFECLECGHIKTTIAEVGSGYKFDVE